MIPLALKWLSTSLCWSQDYVLRLDLYNETWLTCWIFVQTTIWPWEIEMLEPANKSDHALKRTKLHFMENQRNPRYDWKPAYVPVMQGKTSWWKTKQHCLSGRRNGHSRTMCSSFATTSPHTGYTPHLRLQSVGPQQNGRWQLDAFCQNQCCSALVVGQSTPVWTSNHHTSGCSDIGLLSACFCMAALSSTESISPWSAL